jgi:hypothetical protein
LMLASQRLCFAVTATATLTVIPERSVHHLSTSIENNRRFHNGSLSRSIASLHAMSRTRKGRQLVKAKSS